MTVLPYPTLEISLYRVVHDTFRYHEQFRRGSRV